MRDRADRLRLAFPPPVHFLGIGGYGMSGLALVLFSHGIPVSGCDIANSSRVRALLERGIPVDIGHDVGHLDGVGTVVYSTDVPTDVQELRTARQRGLPVVHRSEVLAALFCVYPFGIAVTGTHGKTTSTAMLASVMESGGLDPTVVVGGELAGNGMTARIGGTEYLVAEACESDGTFTRYHPWAALCTNVEPEHLEHYGGSFNRQVEAFAAFLRNTREDGFVVFNDDDPVLGEIAATAHPRTIPCRKTRGESSSMAEGRSYEAKEILLGPQSSRLVVHRGGEPIGALHVPIPGEHMVSNALMVAATALEAGVPFDAISAGLARFRGVGRRFERVGEVDGVRIIDDYAHHPTEIRETLRAVRHLAGDGKVLVVFQPQRYTRTRDLMQEFGASFVDADFLLLTPIYAPAGQPPIPGVSSEGLAERVRLRGNTRVCVEGDRAVIVDRLRQAASAGDVIVTMGAGDVWKIARALVEDSGSG